MFGSSGSTRRRSAYYPSRPKAAKHSGLSKCGQRIGPYPEDRRLWPIGDCPRLTTSSQFLGTEAYMAPERKQNPLLQSVESDVYSLGITFLEAFTGSTTQGDNEEKVPDVFKPIIKKMIRLSPNDRYHSVRDLLTDLSNLPMFELSYGREMV